MPGMSRMTSFTHTFTPAAIHTLPAKATTVFGIVRNNKAEYTCDIWYILPYLFLMNNYWLNPNDAVIICQQAELL